MLACLTRGNFLDVLQEGFNEVTAPSAPPTAQPPSPSASRLISGTGPPAPSSSGGPRTTRTQSPKAALVVGGCRPHG